ncbi:MAG: ArnT family glycosyltransferase, partial [Chloroflexota bacterium]
MKRPFWLLVPAIILFFWLALNSMVGDSPTMDEQNHLARGLAFLRTGDPRLSVEHPPLVNSISTLPLLTQPEIRLPTDHPSWTRPQGWYEFAELLLWEYNDDVTRMIFLARLPIVFLTLALALVGLHFAERLWGPPAGVVAFLLLLFDPNILAHGRYVTTDLGGALFVFLAAFLIWRYWQGPTPKRFFLAGIGLGLAYGSKLSALVFGPIFALLAILPLYRNAWTWQSAVRRLFQFVGMNLIALLIVWALFAFQWGPLEPASPQVAFLDGVSAPMPTFWTGVEQILLISEGGRPSFLLGETSTTGFDAYFPIAFLVKTPPATLLLLVFILGWFTFAMRNPVDWQHLGFLLLPATIYFVVSMQSGLNIG